VTIDAGRGLVSTLNCLRVKTAIVFGVDVGVEFSAAEIRQSLAGRMTTLALERWIVLR
jgi:hypothetical protein